MDIIGKKYFYFFISVIILVPGILSLIFYGLNLSIDFTGGSRLTLLFPQEVSQKSIETIKSEFKDKNIAIASLQPSKERLFIKSSSIPQKEYKIIMSDLHKKIGEFKEENFETVGPVIGSETTWNAVKAVVVSSLLIVLYIAWSFRKVPRPASSLRFGLCAIVALLHDVFVVIGVFSILGHFFGVEIDSLFVTALLTVIGFSVHDTIVVFDRIRENLRRMPSSSFAYVVNESILQTLGRSLNTSITVVLVLFTMVLFGGESIRWFVVALLVGIISGTYSSIFNAAPLLVLWHEWSLKRVKK